MGMSTSARSPDHYVELLDGWRRDCVEHLRENVKSVGGIDEVLKWGHLVYQSNGPVLLIRAEKERVLFGFWRGRRLRQIEPGLKPSGKYEMATLEIRSEPFPAPETVAELVRKAVALNKQLGNPQDAAKKKPRGSAEG